MASIWPHQTINTMRIPRIFHIGDLVEGTTIELDRNASQHVCKVLRLEIDAPLILFNGKGKSVSALLQSVSNKSASVKIQEQISESTESPLQMHIGLGISKGDRMDYAIQKAVELGVNLITPLTTERTIVRLDEKRQIKKLQHWQGVILSACEQCGRSYLPAINNVTSLTQWLSHTSVCKIMFDTEAQKTLSTLDKSSEVSILIGPEGGLSETERSQACEQGFVSLKLGPRILRTETAVVSACSALQVLWGDLG